MALLEVNDLKTHFFTREGVVQAVDGVSFSLEKGKTLGIVGESGCGKSVTALSIMGLIPKPPAQIVSGSVMYEGRDLTKLTERQLEDVRGREIAMIFQDPMTSLNPTLTIGTQITETIRRHYDVSQKQADKKAVELLEKVRIPRASERLGGLSRLAREDVHRDGVALRDGDGAEVRELPGRDEPEMPAVRGGHEDGYLVRLRAEGPAGMLHDPVRNLVEELAAALHLVLLGGHGAQDLE